MDSHLESIIIIIIIITNFQELEMEYVCEHERDS